MRFPQLGVRPEPQIPERDRVAEPRHGLGRMQPVSGGGFIIRDEVATLRAERDGTAHLDAQPDFSIKLKLPNVTLSKLRSVIGSAISEWYEDPVKLAREARSDGVAEQFRAIPGGCDSYADPFCGELPVAHSTRGDNETLVILPMIEGKADLTSYLSKKFGAGDVYASRKKELLDSTREARAEQGAVFRAEQLDRSAELMQRQLEAVARMPDAKARREALFELWDDCAEGDGPLGAAGARARAMVLGWIRAHEQFPPDELTALDARRTSRQPFAP